MNITIFLDIFKLILLYFLIIFLFHKSFIFIKDYLIKNYSIDLTKTKIFNLNHYNDNNSIFKKKSNINLSNIDLSNIDLSICQLYNNDKNILDSSNIDISNLDISYNIKNNNTSDYYDSEIIQELNNYLKKIN
jgi:hypothetical protein